MNYRALTFFFFLCSSLLLSSQNKTKNLTPNELSEAFFGVWLDEKDDVILIATPEYLIFNDHICYYYNILGTVSNTTGENNIFQISYFDEEEYTELNLFLQTNNILYLEKAPSKSIIRLSKKQPTEDEMFKSVRSKWYNSRDIISITPTQLLVNNTSYVIDYMTFHGANSYIVGYNDSQYHLFKIENDIDGAFLYFDDRKFTKETFFQKYRIVIFVSLILLVLLVSYLMFKWKVHATKKKEEIKRKFTEIQLKSIRSQMNPHFVFNALSAIQNLINKNDNEKANHYLTEFSQLMRLTLDKSEKGLVPLTDEIDSIKKYLELENLRFKFKYQINVAPQIDVHHTEIPAMLIQPFVENAIIHGLNEIDGNKQLLVEFNIKAGYLQCIIKDNGIGIKASKVKKGVTVKKMQYGHKLAENRIALINESHNTHAKITVTDLSDNSKTETGTMIEIITPLTY